MLSVSQLRQRLRLTFASTDLESRFRLDRLPSDRSALAAILMVAALFQVVNIPTDRSVTAGGEGFKALLAIRLASATVAIAGALIIRRLREPTQFERVAMWCGILTALGVVASFALLPADYTAHTAWSVLLVLVMYVSLPIPISRQAIVATIFTLGDALILSYLKVLDHPVVRIDIMTAHACAHAIGLVASWKFKRSRRDQFLAAQEVEVAHTLEHRALGELHVLQGILPICAHCKRIRTESGEWSQLEVYVRRHSEADFSHGICPDCEQKFFGSHG